MTQLTNTLGAGPVKRRSIEDEVYLRLRAAILKNELSGGTHLVHEDLAKHFGTSRIPVRDALRRLVNDGLVDVDERGAYRVSRFGIEDVEEIYSLRGLLESRAVQLAVSRLTDDEIEELGRLHEDMQKAAADGDAETYVALNQAFHQQLYESANQPRLLRMIHGLWQGLPPLTPITIHSRLAESDHEHDAIVRAIEARDAAAAAAAMHRHITAAGAALRDYVERHGGGLR